MDPFCRGCGNKLAPDDKFCRTCGRQTDAAPAAPASAPATSPEQSETSVKAIISLVCGLLFFVPLAFIAAIVLGHLGLSEIRKSAGRLKGEGMAIAGLVLGYLWFAGIPIVLIIAAIAIPNLLRAKIAANEAAAVGSIRVINVAEVSYRSAHPDAGYTCSLSDLAAGGLIQDKLASGEKSGFRFELSGCEAGPDSPAISRYQVVAYPVVRNQSGIRAFCSDESAAIKADSEGSSQRCLENGSSIP